MNDLINDIHRRGRLAADWLASQVDENGSLACDGDLGCYYKCVYPLRMAGYSVQASKLLDQVLRLHLREDGDLRNSDEKKTSGTYTSFFCQCYPNGWVTQGAFLLGRFDIVRTLMGGLVRNYYDEDMGSFRISHTPRVELFDVNSGAMALELFLLTDNKASPPQAAGYLPVFTFGRFTPQAAGNPPRRD
jgi:hypothetical protein